MVVGVRPQVKPEDRGGNKRTPESASKRVDPIPSKQTATAVQQTKSN